MVGCTVSKYLNTKLNQAVSHSNGQVIEFTPTPAFVPYGHVFFRQAEIYKGKSKPKNAVCDTNVTSISERNLLNHQDSKKNNSP